MRNSKKIKRIMTSPLFLRLRRLLGLSSSSSQSETVVVMRRRLGMVYSQWSSHVYMVIFTLFCAAILSAFLPLLSSAESALPTCRWSTSTKTGLDGSGHSIDVWKIFRATQVAELGAIPLGCDESSEATATVTPESESISTFTLVPRATNGIARQCIASRATPVVPWLTHVSVDGGSGSGEFLISGTGSESCNGTFSAVSGMGVGSAPNVGCEAGVGNAVGLTAAAFFAGEGVGSATFSEVADVVGICLCKSEYDTAKVTIRRQTIATAIRVFSQGDITVLQPRGMRIIP